MQLVVFRTHLLQLLAGSDLFTHKPLLTLTLLIQIYQPMPGVAITTLHLDDCRVLNISQYLTTLHTVARYHLNIAHVARCHQ